MPETSTDQFGDDPICRHQGASPASHVMSFCTRKRSARTREPAIPRRGAEVGAERACRRFDDDGGYAGNRHTDLNKTEEQMLENFRDKRKKDEIR